MSSRDPKSGCSWCFATAMVASLVGACAPRPPRVDVPAVDRSLAAFDAPIERAMARANVPGCAVAVTYEGRLVYERGYGRIRMAADSPRTPARTRFRIASLTKPITAVAIHLLVERGRLDLDAPIVPLLGLTTGEAGVDPRWDAIHVRHLLEHSGGWDRDESLDPMFHNGALAAALGVPLPLDLDAILRFMRDKPLDFDPGTRFAYSNFGYALLGRILERVVGEPYEAWVRRELLAPMGIARMELGRELPRDRPVDESSYFVDPREPLEPNLFSSAHELVPAADGGFFLVPMAAHGGFIASAADYARFLVHVDGLPNPPDVLSDASMRELLGRPSYADASADFFYAHGFDVELLPDGGRIWFHTGSKPGTTTLALRNAKGFSYVGLCNSRSLDVDFGDELDDAIVEGLGAVERWPSGNGFR